MINDACILWSTKHIKYHLIISYVQIKDIVKRLRKQYSAMIVVYI